MANPIKGSDIYQDDGSIEKLIQDLKKTDEVISSLQDTINKGSKKIGDSFESISDATDQGREAMEKAEKQADDLRKAQEDLNDVNTDNAKTILKLKDEAKSLNAVQKLQIQLTKQQEGSRKALQIQMKLNTAQIEELTAAGKENEKETQDLIKANQDLDKELRDLAKQQKANIKLTEQQEKANNSAEGSYDQLSAQYELNKRALNAMSKEQRETTKEGQDLVQQTADIREEMKRLQSETGNTSLEVGDYKDQMSEALSEQEFFGFSANKLGTIFNSTTGLITVGVAALGALARAYGSSARGANDLARASDRLDAINTTLGNSIANLTGENTNLFDESLKVLLKTSLAYGIFVDEQKVETTVNIKEQLRQLEILEIEQERLKKRQLQRAEIFRQVRDEERNDIEVRRQANIDLGKVIDKREEKSVGFQERRLKYLNDLLLLDEGNLDLQKQIKQTEFEIADIREEAEGFRSEQLINELALSREVNENQLALTEANIKGQILLTEEGSKKRYELEKQLLQETFDLQFDAAGQNKQLQDIANQQFQNGLTELSLAYEAFQKSQTELQKREEEKRQKEAEKKRVEEQRAQEEAERQRIANANAVIEQEFALRKSEIDILKATEKEKTRLVLEAEKDRLNKILELNKTNSTELSELQLKTIENQVIAIDNKINSIQKDDSRSLLEKFGLIINDDQKEAIKLSYDSATEIVDGFIDRRIELADMAVAASEREVDAAQSNLSNQIALAEQGFASNVELAQQELNQAKKNQDEAIKQQQEAQQAQQAIQTVQQTGDLITASAKIWATFGNPFLAIPAIALMWGSFIGAKVRAGQLAKQEFGAGGMEILGGGTHSSGNDTVIGYNNGYELRGEKGEALAVVNRKNTSKYKSILPSIIDSLNNGVFEQTFMGGDGFSSVNVSLEDMPSNIRRMANKPSTYTDGKGRRVVSYKNVTTTYN